MRTEKTARPGRVPGLRNPGCMNPSPTPIQLSQTVLGLQNKTKGCITNTEGVFLCAGHIAERSGGLLEAACEGRLVTAVPSLPPIPKFPTLVRTPVCMWTLLFFSRHHQELLILYLWRNSLDIFDELYLVGELVK